MRGGGGGWARGAVDEEDKLSGDEAKRVVRRALRMLSPYRGQVAVAGVAVVVATAALIAGPALVRNAIDHGLRTVVGSGAKSAVARRRGARIIDRDAVLYVVVALTALVSSRAQILLVTRIGEQFLRDLRVRVFRHLMDMSLGFFDTEQTGRLVARMTADIDSLSEVVQQGLVLFISNALLLVFTVAILVVLSPKLAIVCLISLPIVIAASVRFRRHSNAAYLTVRDSISKTLSTLQEGLSGVRVVQAFAQEDHHLRRFRRHNDQQLDAYLHATRISAYYFPVIELAGIGTTAAIVGIGGWLVGGGAVTVGTIAAFVLYLSNLFEPIQQLSQLFNTLQSAVASLNKLFGLLDTPSPVQERAGAVDLPARGDIEVADLSFAYSPGGVEVLHDVDLTIRDGERIAFVGPTGAGKSTLAKLVARMYDPTRGAIRFGGVDLRDATLRSLRERIVVVPQEGHLFGGTIRDNVRLGREGASDADIAAAMDRIGVLARFEALPDGLDTIVREKGSNFSAGERQLVSLARAALANPSVLVLDEATSSLDPGTEHEVELALNALMEGRTVIVIAHRLSTAERADRVAVVDAGGLAELGTHDELVARGGRYAGLFASWTGGLTATAG